MKYKLNNVYFMKECGGDAYGRNKAQIFVKIMDIYIYEKPIAPGKTVTAYKISRCKQDGTLLENKTHDWKEPNLDLTELDSWIKKKIKEKENKIKKLQEQIKKHKKQIKLLKG